MKSAQLPSARQDSEELEQGSNVNSQCHQIQCDVVQIRQELNERLINHGLFASFIEWRVTLSSYLVIVIGPSGDGNFKIGRARSARPI